MTWEEIMYKGFLGYYLGETGTKSGVAFLLLTTLGFLVLAAAAYVLGSMNFSIIISKKIYGEDIRTYGSGNAGMTNMLRTYGKGPAFITLLTDALKTVLAVMIGRLIWGAIGAYAAGLCCMIGHIYPMFYKFKGGKGVVVVGITILMTNWKVGLILLAIFAILVYSTKFISLGSVMGVLIYPLILSRMLGKDPQIVLLFALAMTVIVVVKHRSNIKRLLEGTENKVSLTTLNKKSADNSGKKGEK